MSLIHFQFHLGKVIFQTKILIFSYLRCKFLFLQKNMTNVHLLKNLPDSLKTQPQWWFTMPTNPLCSAILAMDQVLWRIRKLCQQRQIALKNKQVSGLCLFLKYAFLVSLTANQNAIHFEVKIAGFIFLKVVKFDRILSGVSYTMS